MLATKCLLAIALCVTLVPPNFITALALNKDNHNFFHKTISRVEETVQKLGSIFGLTFSNPDPPPVNPDGQKLWAVLVAGSNGYYNYRHQADICHAYQVLLKHGIPPENIITLMYDDIANNTENPTKGIIINEPGGPDVYKGVRKDYIGNDVTPENFLNVIAGNAQAMKGIGSSRVVNSGPNDHIFINFVDHGAPGLLAFPNSELHARLLQDTLLDMYQKNRYGKLVMYIEACESGSMFEDLLPDNLNIFVTTAANAKEHSFACYYDSHRNTYLGDVYSVIWMQDSEVEDINKETLFKQFSIVRKETNTSHVQEYGNLTIGKMKVAEFQGSRTLLKSSYSGNDDSHRKPISPLLDAVPSGDVPLEILRHRMRASNSNEEAEEIQRKIRHIEKKRQHLLAILSDIVKNATGGDETKTESILTQRMKLADFSCYEELVHAFSDRCFHLSKNEYAYRQLFVLVNLCQTPSTKGSAALRAVDFVCQTHKKKYAEII